MSCKPCCLIFIHQCHHRTRDYRLKIKIVPFVCDIDGSGGDVDGRELMSFGDVTYRGKPKGRNNASFEHVFLRLTSPGVNFSTPAFVGSFLRRKFFRRAQGGGGDFNVVISFLTQYSDRIAAKRSLLD